MQASFGSGSALSNSQGGNPSVSSGDPNQNQQIVQIKPS